METLIDPQGELHLPDEDRYYELFYGKRCWFCGSLPRLIRKGHTYALACMNEQCENHRPHREHWQRNSKSSVKLWNLTAALSAH